MKPFLWFDNKLLLALDGCAYLLYHWFGLGSIWLTRLFGLLTIAYWVIIRTDMGRTFTWFGAFVILAIFVIWGLEEFHTRKRPVYIRNAVRIMRRSSKVLFWWRIALYSLVLLQIPSGWFAVLAWMIYVLFLTADHALEPMEPRKKFKLHIKLPSFSFSNPLPQAT